MNLLIIDDEFYNVEALRMKIEEFRPQFDKIYCAYSMKQAIRIFLEHDIAIMISDIEMPGGSGLELLDTLRQQDINTICIFLTAYAKFEYISRAIKLDTIDYLLKPVDNEVLLAAVDKAIERYQEQQQIRLSHMQAGYWKESELYLMEQFWLDLLQHSVSGKVEELERVLRFRNMNPDYASESFYLLFVQLNPTTELMQNRSLYEFSFKNIAREFFYQANELPVVVRCSELLYMLALPTSGRERVEIIEQCESALHGFVTHFPNTFCFYIGSCAYTMPQIHAAYQQLQNISRENISLDNLILDLDAATFDTLSFHKPVPTDRWMDFLQQNRTDIVQSEAIIYLNQMQHDGVTSRAQLNDYYYQMLHIFFSLLGKQEQTKDMENLRKKLTRQSAEHVCSSFPALKEWTTQTIHDYYLYSIETAQKDNTVTQVKTYIKEHLHEDISRESLASMVYLNADYLSHLFKKETGYSLTNYIIEERIKKSKQLLKDKNLNVRDIAISCGFQNISYFSRQFKKSTGMTPREFRKQ